MNLEGILAIAGKPGLYRLVAQSKGGLIVESIIDNRRFPVNQAQNVSALQDIAIYTDNEEVPLAEVFEEIAKKENLGKAIDHKEAPISLGEYLAEILPDYDRARVYNSDLKKIFQWYNILQAHDFISVDDQDESPEVQDAENDE